MNGSKIARASLGVFSAHIIFKLLGSVQFFAVYWSIDAKTFDAVYGFAFEGVLFSLFLIGEEMIGPALLPLFMQEKESGGELQGWRLVNTVVTIQALIIAVLIAVLFFFPQVALLLTYWKKTQNPEQYHLAMNSLKWMSPALFGLSMASTTYIVLNAYKRFFIAAIADSMIKIGILLSLAIGIGFLGGDYRVLLAGIVLGGTAKLGTHVWGLRNELHYLRPCFDYKNPAFKSLLLLMLPLAIGIFVAKGRDMYNSVTVLSSLNTEGLIKANMFGRKLYQTIGMLIPYTISIALFPFLCELAAKKDTDRLGALLSSACRMLLFVFIPLSLLLVFLSPAASMLIAGGTVSVQEASWAATSLSCYTLVLPAYALEPILMQGFFAQKRTTAVVILGIVCSFISIGVSYSAIRLYHLDGEDALIAIALGYTFSRFLKTALLSLLLRRTLPLSPFASTVIFLLKITPLSILGGLIAQNCYHLCPFPLDGRVDIFFAMLVSAGVGALVIIVGAWSIRLQELQDMLHWSKEKILKHG